MHKHLLATAGVLALLTTTHAGAAAKKADKKADKKPAAAAKKAPAKKGVNKDATALTGKVGTLGLGIEVAKPINDYWDGRIGVNYWKASNDGVEAGINYNGDLRLNTFSFLADYHGKNRQWRGTAGFMVNNNQVDLDANVAAGTAVTIGSTAYNTGGRIDADVDFNTIAPYIGIGYGNPFAPDRAKKDWTFQFDLGLLFSGNPKTKFTTSIAGVTAADLAQEQRELDRAIDNFDVYPVISIGGTYRF